MKKIIICMMLYGFNQSVFGMPYAFFQKTEILSSEQVVLDPLSARFLQELESSDTEITQEEQNNFLLMVVDALTSFVKKEMIELIKDDFLEVTLMQKDLGSVHPILLEELNADFEIVVPIDLLEKIGMALRRIKLIKVPSFFFKKEAFPAMQHVMVQNFTLVFPFLVKKILSQECFVESIISLPYVVEKIGLECIDLKSFVKDNLCLDFLKSILTKEFICKISFIEFSDHEKVQLIEAFQNILFFPECLLAIEQALVEVLPELSMGGVPICFAESILEVLIKKLPNPLMVNMKVMLEEKYRKKTRELVAIKITHMIKTALFLELQSSIKVKKIYRESKEQLSSLLVKLMFEKLQEVFLKIISHIAPV